MAERDYSRFEITNLKVLCMVRVNGLKVLF